MSMTTKIKLKKRRMVLEPANLDEIGLDITKLKICLTRDYLTPGRHEYYQSTSTQNLNLEDGFMEFIVSKCMDGKRIGEGHCPIDVVKDDIGIDVLCVCLNGSQTNEKSVMQKFSGSSNILDVLFAQNDLQKIVDLYKNEYYNKLNSAIQKYKLKRLYYLGFISTNKKIYLTAYKINLHAIFNLKEDGLTMQSKSMYLLNFIEKRFGTTKAYKSKKRMEIRFNREILNDDNTTEIYDLDAENSSDSISQLSQKFQKLQLNSQVKLP